jgi:branched-chain amino acid transport system substrate-binding protein
VETSQQATSKPILVGAPLSLSGRYALQGRLAAAGLNQVVRDVAAAGGVAVGEDRLVPRVAILDDGSTRKGVMKALDMLAEADLLLGPYGSDLVVEAARWASEHGRVLWNHGGSADDSQRLGGLISVASPASRYLACVLEAIAPSLPNARVWLAVGPGRFAHNAAEGARGAAQRLGMTVTRVTQHADVPDSPDVDVLLCAGAFTDDLALVARLRRRPAAVGAVAAGLWPFGVQFRQRADGVLGPSQWEEGARFAVDVGSNQAQVLRALRAAAVESLRTGWVGQHVDYPAAQAYAAGTIAFHAAGQAGSIEDRELEAAARRMRCTTFFGRFGLGGDGRQADHEMLVVQWQESVKRIVWPSSLAETTLSL